MTTPRELLAQYATQSQMSSFFIDYVGIISVKSYGAKGDGTTNDTVAVQAAVTAAVTNGNHELYFPHGTYKVTALTGTSTLTFVGDNSSFTGGYTGTINSFSLHLADYTKHMRSVKDYGAVGDGVADDTTAFQNAINAIKTTHGTLFIPPGRYKITSTLQLPYVGTGSYPTNYQYGYGIVGAGSRSSILEWHGNAPIPASISASTPENEKAAVIHLYSSDVLLQGFSITTKYLHGDVTSTEPFYGIRIGGNSNEVSHRPLLIDVHVVGGICPLGIGKYGGGDDCAQLTAIGCEFHQTTGDWYSVEMYNSAVQDMEFIRCGFGTYSFPTTPGDVYAVGVKNVNFKQCEFAIAQNPSVLSFVIVADDNGNGQGQITVEDSFIWGAIYKSSSGNILAIFDRNNIQIDTTHVQNGKVILFDCPNIVLRDNKPTGSYNTNIIGKLQIKDLTGLTNWDGTNLNWVTGFNTGYEHVKRVIDIKNNLGLLSELRYGGWKTDMSSRWSRYTIDCLQKPVSRLNNYLDALANPAGATSLTLSNLTYGTVGNCKSWKPTTTNYNAGNASYVNYPDFNVNPFETIVVDIGFYIGINGDNWTASKAYSLNNLVIPTTQNGYYYKCTTAGTSGSTEPNWPTVAGNTVSDGTAVWTAYALGNASDQLQLSVVYRDSSHANIASQRWNTFTNGNMQTGADKLGQLAFQWNKWSRCTTGGIIVPANCAYILVQMYWVNQTSSGAADNLYIIGWRDPKVHENFIYECEQFPATS